MSHPARTAWAVVPIKAFSGAKVRLSPAYGPEIRQRLARAMAEDVLAALAGARHLGGIAVVTVDPDAAALALRYGARVIKDGATEGHTGAVSGGFRRLAGEGMDTLMTVPGDIPCVTSDEIDQVLCRHEAAPAFTIVPAHDGRGSNAILMTPPDAVPLAFGDDSFEPHVAAARSRGIQPLILRVSGIGLDIDNPADVELLLQQPPRTRAHAVLQP